MSAWRVAPPRRLGILTGERLPAARSAPSSYPYTVGDRIAGDLTVIGHLAVGRLGHLYQVWSAGEWTALTCKILSPQWRGRRRAAAALRREARILRAVRHPNLIRSYGEGVHDGLPYVLLEYVEGPSLFTLLDGRPGRRLSVSDALRTAIHAAAGLYHLHRRGWLHLDLKPANLVFRSSVPVLVDFDAARRIEPARRPRSPLGTAPYMAPEQIRQLPLAPMADIYALGALLYEMVTGRWPFESVFTGDEPRSGEERFYPQLGSRAAPAPARYNPEIPPSLDRTILRCLAAEPADRFPSMHALMLELVGELGEPDALWPRGVRAERRGSPRP